MSSIVFRPATAADKDAVLALRTGLFAGLDYLAGTYDTYLTHPDAYPHVGLMDGKIVFYTVAMITDNGRCIFVLGSRIRTDLVGKGYFMQYGKGLQYLINKTGVIYSRSTREGNYKTFIKQKDIDKYHVKLISVKSISGFLIPLDAEQFTDNLTTTRPKSVGKEMMKQYITTDQMKKYLFPNGLMIVNRVTYNAIPENMECIYGMKTTFYSNLSINTDGISGLVSGCTTHCGSTKGSWSYRIDIFGNDVSSLHSHFTFHLNRYVNSRKEGKRYLIVVTDQGSMAQQVLSLAKKFNLDIVDRFRAIDDCTIQEETFPESKI